MAFAVHETAIIEPGAELGEDVTIGPFCHIGPAAVIGDRACLHGRITLMGRVYLGSDVEVFPGVILGGQGQVLGAKAEAENRLIVGDRTVLRECVTLHLGTVKGNRETRIGPDSYLMAYSHVGHDSHIGPHNVLANGVQIAGHVSTGAHVWAGGLAAVHQFTEIGDHAFIAGGAILVGDVIPFGMVSGNRARLHGLNLTGLSRRGFSKADIKILRQAYKSVFKEHTDLPFADRVARAGAQFGGHDQASKLIEFLKRPRSRPLCGPGRP
ncbi:MAG: acyl-ACP--UDP-N-acetylglucosamine O-acyltransferase [Pseudomonadota bacterium]